MRTAVLVFAALHAVHSLFANGVGSRGGRRLIRVDMLLIQLPLFVIAAVIAFGEGVLGRDLLNPVYIGAGLVLGHVVFVLSLLAIHRCVSDAREVLLGFGSIWGFACESPLVLSRYVGVAFTEEVIYRVAIQGSLILFLNSSWAGIGITAVLFSVVHAHFFRNSFVQSCEFVLFAILIGVLYWMTGSLVFVVAIHAVRNIEIAYLDYLTKLDELGDESQALLEIERSVINQQSDLA